MSKLPSLTGSELVRILRKHGFAVVRIKGSHQFLRHPDGRCTTVSVHRGEAIGRGLLAQIMRDVDLSRDDISTDRLKG